MFAEGHTVRECESCHEVGLDIDRSRIDGEERDLCPNCSRRVALGGEV